MPPPTLLPLPTGWVMDPGDGVVCYLQHPRAWTNNSLGEVWVPNTVKGSNCPPGLVCEKFPFVQMPDLGVSYSSSLGLPGGANGKELVANAGDTRDAGSIPGSGRSPAGRHGNPLQYSCLRIPWTEKPGGLQSTGSQRVTRLQRLSTHACILAIEPLPVPVSVHSLVPMGKMCERDLPLHLRPQPFSSPSPHAIKSAFPSVREGPPGRQWSRILATPLQPTQRK